METITKISQPGSSMAACWHRHSVAGAAGRSQLPLVYSQPMLRPRCYARRRVCCIGAVIASISYREARCLTQPSLSMSRGSVWWLSAFAFSCRPDWGSQTLYASTILRCAAIRTQRLTMRCSERLRLSRWLLPPPPFHPPQPARQPPPSLSLGSLGVSSRHPVNESQLPFKSFAVCAPAIGATPRCAKPTTSNDSRMSPHFQRIAMSGESTLRGRSSDCDRAAALRNYRFADSEYATGLSRTRSIPVCACSSRRGMSRFSTIAPHILRPTSQRPVSWTHLCFRITASFAFDAYRQRTTSCHSGSIQDPNAVP